VTQDEIDRSVKPRVESIQRSQASNEYWLSQLAGAQTDPRRLAAIRESIPGLQKVTPVEVQRAAERFLLENKAFRVVVLPEKAAAAR
jgi:zinc protease